MERLNIAVIGSGISGLSAAWLLARRHRVTLYEAGGHLGGHANTVDVQSPEGPIAVDTGFIVYNELNYPNLVALFQHLGVATEPTEMSFALSLDAGTYEYSGSGLNGFFGQRRNFGRPRHWRLLAELARFFRTAGHRVESYPDRTSLGAFLDADGYGADFVEDHIVPMGAAIWSTSMDAMLEFPARGFVQFYANHGMLQFRGRPAWRTVKGGSRRYVERLVADGGFEVQRQARVRRVVRQSRHVHIEDERGAVRPFDHAVIATHADQALKLLDEPGPLEARTLGAFAYQSNRAVLHRDRRWMPRRRRLWSSWNYMKRDDGLEPGLCVSYWMNRLQSLRTASDLFVTLNPAGEIEADAVEAAFDYDHPVFDAAAIEAQKRLWDLQGMRRTWFCGSYFGFGFHEDGAQSGLAVAEMLGGVRRPWRVASEFAPHRPAGQRRPGGGRMNPVGDGLYMGQVVHKRLRPLPHALRYDVFSLLLDCDRLDTLHQSLRLLSHNRFNLFGLYDRDHGDGTALRGYLRGIAARAVQGGEIRRFLMLCYPRILGYVFNPLTVYFGLDAQDRVRVIVYEVNNTFGERKSYVLPAEPDEDGLIVQGCRKRFYVSPFNTDEGHYRFHATSPADSLTVGVALEDGHGPLLKAHFRGRRLELTDTNLLRALTRTGWMTVKVIAGIHYEALKLWLKGLRLVPRPPAPETPIVYMNTPTESR